jgi:membrane associated rhomboid family serine protease
MSFWRGRGLSGAFYVLGARIPAVTGGLIGLTLAVSVVGALGDQLGAPLRDWLLLEPRRVWQGELWRLLTWVFVEANPLSLILGCLMLWVFGGELNNSWGPRRFLGVYAGFAVAAGALTSLLARLAWPTLMGVAYFRMWPVVEALIIAWAVLYPHRQILFYLVLPVSGRALVYVTVGGTLLYALLVRVELFVPDFIAQGLMLLYLRPVSPRYLWLRFKYAAATRRRPTLRAVDRRDRGEPPRWLH